MIEIIESLGEVCEVRACQSDHSEKAFRCIFRFESAPLTKVIVRIAIEDDFSLGDFIITNINTEPPLERDKGYGTHCVKQIIALVPEDKVILAATVINEHAQRFWQRLGFVPTDKALSDYVYNNKGPG